MTDEKTLLELRNLEIEVDTWTSTRGRLWGW